MVFFLLLNLGTYFSSHTHVVVIPVIRVISIVEIGFLKNTDLKLVRNCFDIRPYSTKPIAAFINANRSMTSPKSV